MRARYAGKCVCGCPIEPGQQIQRLGRRWAHAECVAEAAEQLSMRPATSSAAGREYERGRSEVEQIQAVSAAGSELRELLYLEMEQAAWNRGEE